MTSAKLSAAERRRLRRVESAALDRLAEADGRFFSRFPERRTRVRWAGRAEVDAVPGNVVASLSALLPGMKVAIAARLIGPGLMLTTMFPAPGWADLDVSEREAAAVFERFIAGQQAAADLLTRALLDDAIKAGGAA